MKRDQADPAEQHKLELKNLLNCHTHIENSEVFRISLRRKTCVFVHHQPLKYSELYTNSIFAPYPTFGFYSILALVHILKSDFHTK